MKRMNDIAIIILAAGSSSRMGQSKQLLLVDGEPLLLKTVKTALEVKAASVIVILGAQDQQHATVIQNLAVDIVFNKVWEKGMGSSLKAGLQFIVTHVPAVESAIILVCDQPALTSEHLLNLIQTYKISGKSIIASYYSNTPGVPVLFGKPHFDELLHLDDSQGAKKIIQQNMAVTEFIHFPEGTIDLDTPGDYQRYINSLKIEKPS
jgi:molybdenum cofactor cytidylyltransferase